MMSITWGKRVRATTALALVAGAMVVGPLAVPASATPLTDGCLTYEVGDTSVMVTGGVACVGAVTIPATVSSKPVVGIDIAAFRTSTTVTSITIPASVTEVYTAALADMPNLAAVTFAASLTPGLTTLDWQAFGNDPLLTSISLPTSVTTIGDGAFYHDTLLATANLGTLVHLTSIGVSAFEGTALRSVTIPATVTLVDTSAFAGCTHLGSVTYATGSPITVINASTFDGAPLGGTLRLPMGVTSIGQYAFRGSQFNYVTLPTSLQTIGDDAFSGSALRYVTLPAGVSSIGASAFLNNAALGYVSLPEGLTTIGDLAFQGTALQSIDIPSTVTSIGMGAFYEVTSLVTLNLPATGSLDIGTLAFKGTRIGGGTYGDGSLTITPAVTMIGNSAFKDVTSLTSVTLPDTGSLGIGGYAFWNTNLTSLIVPATVTSIGGSAFYGLTTLTHVTLPETGTLTIGPSAFENSGLTGDLVITPAVTAIGNAAFKGTAGLASVSFPATGSMTVGTQAFYHSGVATATVGASVTEIGSEAFSGASNLHAVTFAAAGLTSLGSLAFASTVIGNLTLPTTLTTLGLGGLGDSPNTSAFALAGPNASFSVAGGVLFNSDGTELVAYPAGKSGAYVVPAAASIGRYAFQHTSGLTTLTFAAGTAVTTIPDHAFAQSSLTGITLPATLTGIGAEAFKESGLTSVSIPAGVLRIADAAFSGSASLASARFYGNAPALGDDVFLNTAMGTVYYNPALTGWDTLLADKLSGFDTVRMAAPVYAPGSAVAVSSIARVKRNVRAYPGTWDSDATVVVTFAWFKCKRAVAAVGTGLPGGAKCSVIAGKHGSFLPVVKGYRGFFIVAQVTATNEYGSTTRYTRSSARVR